MGFWNWLTGGASDVIDSVGKIIDDVSTTDEEKLTLKNKLQDSINSFILSVMDKQSQYDKELTERLKADMNSDSWLSKNIRPLTLVFILTMYSVLSIASGADFTVNESYVKLLGEWGMLIMSFYFGGRTVEKIVNSLQNLRNKGSNERTSS